MLLVEHSLQERIKESLAKSCFCAQGVEFFKLVDDEQETGRATLGRIAVLPFTNSLEHFHQGKRNLFEAIGKAADGQQPIGLALLRFKQRHQCTGQGMIGAASWAKSGNDPAVLLSQYRNQSGVNDRRFAAPRRAYNGDQWALIGSGDQLIDEFFPTKEIRRVLFSEGKQAPVWIRCS